MAAQAQTVASAFLRRWVSVLVTLKTLAETCQKTGFQVHAYSSLAKFTGRTLSPDIWSSAPSDAGGGSPLITRMNADEDRAFPYPRSSAPSAVKNLACLSRIHVDQPKPIGGPPRRRSQRMRSAGPSGSWRRNGGGRAGRKRSWSPSRRTPRPSCRWRRGRGGKRSCRSSGLPDESSWVRPRVPTANCRPG